jgi:hypothetical protein
MKTKNEEERQNVTTRENELKTLESNESILYLFYY